MDEHICSDREFERLVARKYGPKSRVTTLVDFSRGMFFAEEVREWARCGPILSRETSKKHITPKNLFFAPKMLKVNRWGKNFQDYLDKIDNMEAESNRLAEELEKEMIEEVESHFKIQVAY